MGPPHTLGTSYALDEGLVAVHGDAPAGEKPVASLEGDAITVVDAPSAAQHVGPVYRAGPGGPIAVPTGRVFVRFQEGTDAASRAGELAAAGFSIESVPSYAPHAAWVRPGSESVADALVDLDRLRALPGVENVEPQLVSEAARR
jgi:hypothetical protein